MGRFHRHTVGRPVTFQQFLGPVEVTLDEVRAFETDGAVTLQLVVSMPYDTYSFLDEGEVFGLGFESVDPASGDYEFGGDRPVEVTLEVDDALVAALDGDLGARAEAAAGRLLDADPDWVDTERHRYRSVFQVSATNPDVRTGYLSRHRRA
jgi:hypothetical protein